MSDQINHETGESMQGRSPRFTLWVAFLVFATITMGSSVEVKNLMSSPTSEVKWAIACSAVTFAITVLMVVAHLVPVCSAMVIATRAEGIIIFVLAIFWAATVAIVTNPALGLGASNSNPDNQVNNGNLYYFSWAGFVTSIILLVNYWKHAFGVDVVGQVQNRAARLSLWASLFAGSVVVLGSSVQIFNDNRCASGASAAGEVFCRRTTFSLSCGALGVIFAMVVVAMKMLTTSAPFLVESVLAVILTFLDAFQVAYTTSPSGPGSAIGNLYYFSWISFLCAALLLADCFNQYSGRRTVDSEESNGSSQNIHKNDHTDIDVENLDDQI